ncbi:hypothetical protein CMV37_25700, partial [Bacillus cereus]
KLDCFPVENFVYERSCANISKYYYSTGGMHFVPFGIAIASYFWVTNEHNINFYSGKGNVMMEELFT